MQDKKDIILNKCRDLIYKEAFKMPYDKVKLTYTDYQINNKLDKFLTDLIERGELFYGDNFIKDFINERTDEARTWLLNDVLYGNGIDVDLPKKETKINSSEKREEPPNEDTKKNKLKDDTKNNQNISSLDIDEPKEEMTFERLFSEIVDKCGWPKEAALKLLSDRAKDEKIRKQAKEELEKLLENKEKQENKEQMPQDEVNKPLENNDNIQESNDKDDTKELPKIDGAIEVQTKEPKPKLLQRFKEKIKDPKFRKKLIIAGVVIAVGAIAVVLNPDLQQFLGGLINNVTNVFSGNEITNVTDVANVADVTMGNNVDTVSTAATSFDLNSIGEGTEVYQTQADALNNTNQLDSNIWMHIDQLEAMNPNGEVIDVTGLSPENINDLADSGYTFRGLNDGTYMGHFDSNTISDLAEQQMGRSR